MIQVYQIYVKKIVSVYHNNDGANNESTSYKYVEKITVS